MKKSLVICSGGLDSVSMALLKLKEGNYIELMSFNYGQKAKKEIDVVRSISKELNCKSNIIDLSNMKEIFGYNQLTNNDTIVENNYKKNVVVTLRNALFLQIASIYAITNSFDEVVLGAHLDDCVLVNGQCAFPDCSPSFFKQFEKTIHEGTLKEQKKLHIVSASTMGLHKNDLIRIAYDINQKVLFESWSCYKNGSVHCGVCDSCRNRRNSFKLSNIEDKTRYQE